MGFTGLARWTNAPPTGLKDIQDNIQHQNGVYRGPWRLSVSSYRSAFSAPGGPPERSIFALTMDQNVFVLVEDPNAPVRADVVASGDEAAYLQRNYHYRNTFLTLRPPGGLEQLLAQLNARWKPVREGAPQRGQPIQQLAIDGHIYALGTDWIVRVGNVVLAGGAIKGMILEAEYLPLPVLHSPTGDGTSELVSNLLTSILPIGPDARAVAITISDAQWEDVLWDGEPEPEEVAENEEDVYAWDDATPRVVSKKRDWFGIHQYQRPRSTLARPRLFYQNKQLELYASREAHRLTLRQLLFFGRATSTDTERLIKSANYVRSELPVRIAHRLRDMQTLPYIVVTQEGVAKVYELYWTAFDKFRQYPPITTLEENAAFCEFLANILREHWSVIPSLSLGLSLASPYLSSDALDSFMRRMLVSRISRRVLAEHHIALSAAHSGQASKHADPHVGIIFTGLDVKRSLEKCASILRDRGKGWPEIVVDGHVDTRFAYIKEHLEYILFELLKNAMQATAAHHRNSESLPVIQATISAGTNDVGVRITDQGGGLVTVKTPSDLFSFSHLRNAARLEDSKIDALRSVSASPLGIRATVDEQVGRWKEHVRTPAEEPDLDPEVKAGVGHSRIGIGLPMSNIFATYFGGSLELVTMNGWGTDVYLRLPKLGTNLEGIEV
ncbi:Protein-serine/threonine kinase [Mycena kentingensis (nom. inval.)]|nr:Protein-serine/threonine kinase [Mycena kentingensis (nom. inval.)]